MPREIEPSLSERTFVLQALKESIRVDGRGLDDFRTLSITFGVELGQVDVSLGRTRVLAKISAEVVRPYADKPTEGFLTIASEISPMASPAFELGRPSEEEILVSRLVEKSLRRSRAIDTEGLCIVAGEKVWSIRVDLHFLDHDGNIVDVACIAAITGLLHFKRPDVTVSGEEVTIHSVEQRNPVPLSVHHIPVCVTFGFFDNGDLRVVDPCLLEQQNQEGDMTITMNMHKEICALSKAGGISLSTDQINACTSLAYSKVCEITETIKKALETDAQKRQTSSSFKKKATKGAYVGVEQPGV